MPQDALDYQRVIELSWRSPVPAFLLWERASRAPIVSAVWMDPTSPRDVEITARVATRDRAGFCPDISSEERAEYLRPTASSPIDGIVLAKAREIVGARSEPIEKARAIYDWIGTNRAAALRRPSHIAGSLFRSQATRWLPRPSGKVW